MSELAQSYRDEAFAEVRKKCFAEGFAEGFAKGFAKCYKSRLLTDITNLTKSLDISITGAMSLLLVPEQEQKSVLDLLEKNEKD